MTGTVAKNGDPVSIVFFFSECRVKICHDHAGQETRENVRVNDSRMYSFHLRLLRC